ncbi:MAG: hypothetical protein B7Z26_01730 [Asticcacaulis sp. 32-58-5]|nr:MAG: hypothetical protein B7Z26_01730 [Asticcacaulis sp. 32-58-5]
MKRRDLISVLLFPVLATLAPQALAGGAPKEKKKGGGPSFTQLTPISVFIPRRDGRHATMTIEVGLDVKDPKLAELVPVYIPRLPRTSGGDRSGIKAGWRYRAARHHDDQLIPHKLIVIRSSAMKKPFAGAKMNLKVCARFTLWGKVAS